MGNIMNLIIEKFLYIFILNIRKRLLTPSQVQGHKKINLIHSFNNTKVGLFVSISKFCKRYKILIEFLTLKVFPILI